MEMKNQNTLMKRFSFSLILFILATCWSVPTLNGIEKTNYEESFIFGIMLFVSRFRLRAAG